MSKARSKVVVVLGALGVLLLGALAAPAVASADPWQPYWTGPWHPVAHYAGDIDHPVWAVTHPVRSLTP